MKTRVRPDEIGSVAKYGFNFRSYHNHGHFGTCSFVLLNDIIQKHDFSHLHSDVILIPEKEKRCWECFTLKSHFNCMHLPIDAWLHTFLLWDPRQQRVEYRWVGLESGSVSGLWDFRLQGSSSVEESPAGSQSITQLRHGNWKASYQFKTLITR